MSTHKTEKKRPITQATLYFLRPNKIYFLEQWFSKWGAGDTRGLRRITIEQCVVGMEFFWEPFNYILLDRRFLPTHFAREPTRDFANRRMEFSAQSNESG